MRNVRDWDAAAILTEYFSDVVALETPSWPHLSFSANG